MVTSNFRVSHYMRTNSTTIQPSATFSVAVETMLQAKTNGLVVVDTNHMVVGILSGWDLIQYIIPDYLDGKEYSTGSEAEEIFARRVKEVAHDPVSKFMTKAVHTIKPTDTLMRAAAILSEFYIRQLPVVDEQNKLIGYINRTDIKYAIGHALGIGQ